MKQVDEERGEHLRPKRHMMWAEYGQLETKLVEAITGQLAEKHEHVDMILGIFRGGLVIARCLVSRLGELPLAIIRPQDEGSMPGRLACVADEDIYSIPGDRRGQMNVLLVDDISDTGRTFEYMKASIERLGFRRVYTASLVLKSYSAFIPDFVAEKDDTRDWIVFPWESGASAGKGA
ncbi:MAG: phosphoribosyltransferase [Candidatus Sigynarchaeota archaeon]